MMLLAGALAFSACTDEKKKPKDAPAEDHNGVPQTQQSGSGKQTADTGQPPWDLDSTKLRTHASGLQYQTIREGSGEVPENGEKVIAHYHGTLPTGKVFDSSYQRGQPFSFVLGQGRVIQGWDIAFGLFPVGTQAILVVPPELGYGNRNQGSIPPGSTLRFDVELIGTAPAPKRQPRQMPMQGGQGGRIQMR
jgi:FKBP-type peptidyl-prolyl cis-trans isomerase